MPQRLKARGRAALFVAAVALCVGPLAASARSVSVVAHSAASVASAQTLPEVDAHTSLSIGEPNRGRLLNGVELESDALLNVRSDAHGENFGTRETVEAVRRLVQVVADAHPGTPRLVIGDLSRSRGGRIRPHKSHQSGRDIDTGFYHRAPSDPSTFVPATAANLDLERTWTLIKALHEDDGVQYVFIDRRVQKVLHAFARDVKGVDAETLSQIFEYPQRKSRVALVRHRRGHRNHIHIRYFSPEAVAAGERLGPQMLARLGEPQSESSKVRQVHRVRSGDTLARIAQRHRVDLTDLMRWNHLKRRSKLQIGQSIAIFKPGARLVPKSPAPGAVVCHAGPFGAVGCWPPPRT